MHFCEDAAREKSRFSSPVKTFLNWTIPAFVNIKVGSPAGTSEALFTLRWPFCPKYSRNRSLISSPVHSLNLHLYGIRFRTDLIALHIFSKIGHISGVDKKKRAEGFRAAPGGRRYGVRRSGWLAGSSLGDERKGGDFDGGEEIEDGRTSRPIIKPRR